MRPQPGSYPAFFDNYISKVSEHDVIEALEKNHILFKQILEAIPEEKGAYAYAAGKWTVKQVINHLSDAERVFSYRALRFARRDPLQVLPFEEDDYAAASAGEVANRSLKDTVQEFDYVRLATRSLFKGLSAESLNSSGQTAGGKATVLSLGFIICGHANHHLQVLNEKYL